jgi:hypothetical protein
MTTLRVSASWLIFFWFTCAAGTMVAQTGPKPERPRVVPPVPILITGPVNEAELVTLPGNTRPEANAKNDRGRLPDGFRLLHMMLLLRRSPMQEQALEKLIDRLHDPHSPDFHRWLTAQELGERYGLAQEDIDSIIGWLKSHGLRVNTVYANQFVIDFSGTAGEVLQAFHAEIHRLEVGGKQHIANMTDPRIPAVLAPAVAGVVSLSDFMPHPMHQPRGSLTAGGGNYFVAPTDLATIYNLNPLFEAGVSGQGQTIVLVEDSDVYSTANWATFRSVLGLAGFTEGSFTETHPGNCTDPLPNSDDGEAILDAEWASAAAPSAAILMITCQDTNTSFGGFIALQNLLNAGSPPAIVSISYGGSETEETAAGNAFVNSLYQQAVTAGVSVFVSSGDGAADMSDDGKAYATHGINVNGLGSTVYNVSVGGTDFGDTFAGTNGTYWSATNGTYYGSALSYVPEIPWNDSCASLLISTFSHFSTTYGTSGFCNSPAGEEFLDVTGGSGGPSACATGAPEAPGIVGGTCKGYPKPLWQSVFGNPADGVRDLPDVSLFAANGVWGHAYVFCNSDPSGGTPCSGSPQNWSIGGGTSFASPIMAAIQALINQATGERWGNPNPTYYALAASEYGVGGNSECNSTLGNGVAGTCIFYDETLGDMDVPCQGIVNCYRPSGTYGVLSTSNSAYQPAYGTHVGWDFATGIGTVNAYNLEQAFVTRSRFSVTRRVALGDFNGDGKADILWREDHTGQNAVWLLNGTTVSSSGYLSSLTDLNWQIVGVGDFNGDGKADILWRHAVTGENVIWFMNGTTVSSTGSLLTISNLDWQVVGVGDFNGDGKADILWRDVNTGQNVIWLMNGTTVSSSGSLPTIADLNWQVVGVGDFNGDGKADILWREEHTGQNAMWLMNGTTVSSSGSPPTITDLNWQVAGVGDFNGDGKADILWYEENTGQTAVWLMNGITISSSGSLTTESDLNWQVVGVGDFNGNGKADILWRHFVTGENSIWFMNGVSVSSSGFLPTLADLNWEVF